MGPFLAAEIKEDSNISNNKSMAQSGFGLLLSEQNETLNENLQASASEEVAVTDDEFRVQPSDFVETESKTATEEVRPELPFVNSAGDFFRPITDREDNVSQSSSKNADEMNHFQQMLKEMQEKISSLEAKMTEEKSNYQLDVKHGCKGDVFNLAAQIVKTAFSERRLKVVPSPSHSASTHCHVGTWAVNKLGQSQFQHVAESFGHTEQASQKEFAEKLDITISNRNSQTHFDNQVDLLKRVIDMQKFIGRHEYLEKDQELELAASIIMKYRIWQTYYPKNLAHSDDLK